MKESTTKFVTLNLDRAKAEVCNVTETQIVLKVTLSDAKMRCGSSVHEDFMRAGMGENLSEVYTEVIMSEIQNRIIKEILFD